MVKEVIPTSERITKVTIDSKPRAFTIVQVYTSTSKSEDDEIKEFYNALNKVLTKVNQEIVIYNTSVESELFHDKYIPLAKQAK